MSKLQRMHSTTNERNTCQRKKKTLPQLRESNGCFKTVYTSNKQYMMFKFRNTVGCKSTESAVHDALRNPTKKYARMEEKSFVAGWKFMYPHVPSNVTIHDILADHDIENTVNMLEEERLKRFIQVLVYRTILVPPPPPPTTSTRLFSSSFSLPPVRYV